MEKIVKLKGIDLSQIVLDSESIVIQKPDSLIKEFRPCIRPGHKSMRPYVYAEYKDDQLISHNYGHAGLGYCLNFGTVKRSIDNFEILSGKLSKDREITIVGCGIIGLTTTLRLYERGYTNLKIIAADFGDGKITSFGAGALIYLCFDEVPNTLEDHQQFKEDFNESCLAYQKILKEKHEYLSQAVRYVDYYTDEDFGENGLKNVLNNDVIGLPVKVKLSLEHNPRIF